MNHPISLQKLIMKEDFDIYTEFMEAKAVQGRYFFTCYNLSNVWIQYLQIQIEGR